MMAVTTAARWSITSGRPVSCEDGPAAARKQQTLADPLVVGCRRGRPPGLIPPPVPAAHALDHGQHTAKAWGRCIRGVDLAAVHNHDGVWRQAPKPDKYLRNETTASNTLCA